MELLFSVYVVGVVVVASYYGLKQNWYRCFDLNLAIRWPVLLFYSLSNEIIESIEELRDKLG